MLNKFLLAGAATVLSATVASGAVVVTDTTQLDNGFAVSSADLLQTHLANTASTGGFSREGEVGLPALTDGVFGTQGNQGGGGLAATADGSNSVTLTLDGAYNLTSIATFSGWDNYRGGQSYTVSYATSAAPTTFSTLASEYNNAFEGGNVNTRAVITSTSPFLAYDVVSLKFAFNGDLQYGYAGYREIDAFGSVVPEPGAWAMLIAGFGMVGFAARRRSSVVAV